MKNLIKKIFSLLALLSLGTSLARPAYAASPATGDPGVTSLVVVVVIAVVCLIILNVAHKKNKNS
jgi:hypothetical protein